MAATYQFKIYFLVNSIKVAFGTNPRGDKIEKETMRPSDQDSLESSLHVRLSGDIVRFTRERARVRSSLPVWLENLLTHMSSIKRSNKLGLTSGCGD